MIECKNECPLEKFDGCCHYCPDHADCSDACDDDPNSCGQVVFDEETGLRAFRETQIAAIHNIAFLTSHMKALEEQEKQMKTALYDAMQKYGVKKFESDVLNLTLVGATTGISIDSTKLKKKYPDIAAECSKTTTRAGYVKITLKE